MIMVLPEYVIQVKGEDEEGYKIGKIAAFQIQKPSGSI